VADLRWPITVKSGLVSIVARASGPNLVGDEKTTPVKVYPKLDKSAISGLKYVPAPLTIEKEYAIGCYYFPGWHTYDRWEVLDEYPNRKPILGYYREGDPEVADWHLSWAASHGIDFMIYDWYWAAGNRMLEHALHDGYLKSKYQDKVKFCLLWANHNAPGTSSAEDMINVTRYWINNYFKLPNYQKIDGKNVVVVFSPNRFTEDMGSEAVRSSFDTMRKMCEEAGVGGLYLVACTYPGPDNIKLLEKEGYDALSGYNYPSANLKGQQFAPYEWMVEGYKDYWNQIYEAATIPYIPVCEPGWDARPWHGLKSYVRTGKSPHLWQGMLENAKEFVDTPGRRLPGGRKVVFLEAWNELGEGDYIEPHAEFGFDYLEAVRQVFAPTSTAPTIVVPADIGLGPYDLKPTHPLTEWDFDNPEECLWSVGNMAELAYSNGSMTAVAANGDPAFYSPGLQVDAEKYRRLEIKMKMDKGEEAQVFFARKNGHMSEKMSTKFKVTPDGEYHVYTIDLASNPLWKGTIRQIRIDPNSEAGSRVWIDYVRFLP
jgi:hypothetical protein